MILNRSAIASLLFVTLLLGCTNPHSVPIGDVSLDPRYLKIQPDSSFGCSVLSISPYDLKEDTLSITSPFRNIVVMSTSHVGFLDALSATTVVKGVSGLDYVCSPSVLDSVQAGAVLDVGPDIAPNYERILSLHPDLVLAYSVSDVVPDYVKTLESLGIRVFMVNEHHESHPLARASYVRLFGALTGRLSAADSVLGSVCESYDSIASSVGERKRKVLLNIPYNNQWFIPGGSSYLATLVSDAGGEVLGAVPGAFESSVISVEEAYALAKDADCWINVGWCSTMGQLEGENPLFGDFVSAIRVNAAERGYCPDDVVWNSNKRLNPHGGNDFWESGVVHPDRILNDLALIFSDRIDGELYYYSPVRR